MKLRLSELGLSVKSENFSSQMALKMNGHTGPIPVVKVVYGGSREHENIEVNLPLQKAIEE